MSWTQGLGEIILTTIDRLLLINYRLLLLDHFKLKISTIFQVNRYLENPTMTLTMELPIILLLKSDSNCKKKNSLCHKNLKAKCNHAYSLLIDTDTCHLYDTQKCFTERLISLKRNDFSKSYAQNTSSYSFYYLYRISYASSFTRFIINHFEKT